MKDKTKFLCISVLCLALAVPSTSFGRFGTYKSEKKDGQGDLQRILVLTGENVHNVGELQMHVGNWGNFGSWPGSANAFSEAPSAQWPAGSGVEYLFVAGLWVGAIKNEVPAVTTSAYAAEFRPTQAVEDIIYQTAEGARGGNRLPSAAADDDNDGSIDEDWLNGWDDDGDGAVDEDFAAVSKQMFSCQYIDDGASSIQIYPQHNPLHLHVRQESYQWEEDRFDDFVGANFWITNTGDDVLYDLYIGFFADGDAGSRETDNYWEDDATGFLPIPVDCTDLGPVSIDIAYTYDADGDEGNTPGYFGILFLGHTTDPQGVMAPDRVGIATYANFSGSQSFDEGGDPTNDFERYELLSSNLIERDATVPRDYRMLMAAGPFLELNPGSTLVFQTAFVIGNGREGRGSMRENAGSAQLTYNGAWFNLDGLRNTGVDGRETAVPGPIDLSDGIAIDTCREEYRTPVVWPFKRPLYINNDCAKERLFRNFCGYSDEDSAKYRTGIAGQEAQVFWIVGTAPPAPNLRVDDHSADGLVLYWDNFSETVVDVKTQIQDFEGYRVWRADNWNRPLGTSAANGPARELWKLMFETDIANDFGADTGLDRFRYEPLTQLLSPGRKRDMIEAVKEHLIEFPNDEPPCPPGVTAEVCDTITKLALWEMGSDDGRQYYRFVDKQVHRGRPYFYSVTAFDHAFDRDNSGREILKTGKAGDPSSNFTFVEPRTPAQPDYAYDRGKVYVVPNPATTESMADWRLEPNNDDPTGIKVEFRNLPADEGEIRIYTLAGDLVQTLDFDGRTGVGTREWDLVSRNLQDVTSGVYLYSVETKNNKAFERKIGKFVIIR